MLLVSALAKQYSVHVSSIVLSILIVLNVWHTLIGQFICILIVLNVWHTLIGQFICILIVLNVWHTFIGQFIYLGEISILGLLMKQPPGLYNIENKVTWKNTTINDNTHSCYIKGKGEVIIQYTKNHKYLITSCMQMILRISIDKNQS